MDFLLLPVEMKSEIRQFLDLQSRGRLALSCECLNKEDKNLKIPEDWRYQMKSRNSLSFAIYRDFCYDWIKVIDSNKLPYELSKISHTLSRSGLSSDDPILVKIIIEISCACPRGLVSSNSRNTWRLPKHTATITWQFGLCKLDVWEPKSCECKNFNDRYQHQFKGNSLKELYLQHKSILLGEWIDYEKVVTILSELVL